MPEGNTQIAIVDYQLGNLFSVQRACENVGLTAEITSCADKIRAAEAVILPGVGAFGDAMETLHELGLVPVLQEIAASRTPLIGICLGLQLLMTESFEFGRHQGLDIVRGTVKPLNHPHEGERALKVPQVGWNQVDTYRRSGSAESRWEGTLLEGIADGEYMYFVHSLVVEPEDSDVIVSTTTYGGITFCSSLAYGSVFACQFHPERSAAQGLQMYRNLARMIPRAVEGVSR